MSCSLLAGLMTDGEDMAGESAEEPADKPSASVDPKLLDLLVCPLTRGRLYYDRDKGELISEAGKLAYPIRDGIPIMLVSEARQID